MSEFRDQLIIDVGMHIGQDTAFYLDKGFRVIAIEANPQLVKAAKIRFSDAIAKNHLEIIEGAIADQSGEVAFYIDHDKTLYASIRPESAGQAGGKLDKVFVPTIQFDEILKRANGLHYLKCDIEMADRFVLEALLRSDRRPKFVSVEAHTLEYAALLVTAGYDRFKLINQARYKRWILPVPPLEGRSINHEFEMHSSGPFGDETIGEWVSFNRLTQEYNAACHLTALNPNIFSAWFDIHATCAVE